MTKDPIQAAADAFPEAETPTQIAKGGKHLTDEEVEQFNKVAHGHGLRAKIEGKVAERKQAKRRS